MKRRVLCVLLWILAAACSGGDGEGGNANITVSLTDAPSMELAAINVTITTVRIHRSADAGSGEAGWHDLQVSAGMPVDLLSLTNGRLYRLAEARLEPGHYQQVRLVLRGNGARPPWNNSVVLPEGTEAPLVTPSTEIRLSHGFRIEADARTDLVVDFEGQASVHQAGGKYVLRPVVKAFSSVNPRGSALFP